MEKRGREGDKGKGGMSKGVREWGRRNEEEVRAVDWRLCRPWLLLFVWRDRNLYNYNYYYWE